MHKFNVIIVVLLCHFCVYNVNCFIEQYEEFYLSENLSEDIDNVLVVPKVLNFNNERRKRSIFTEHSDAGISLEIDDWILLLDENTFLSFDNDFIEIWNDNNTREETYNDCKFYKGTILYEAESIAVITVCNRKYYYGFFSTARGKSYFIEPTILPANGHIVYKAKLPTSHTKVKRCVEGCDVPEVFNLTGDISLDGINFNFTDEETGDGKMENILGKVEDIIVREVENESEDIEGDEDDIDINFEEKDLAEGKMKKRPYHKGKPKYDNESEEDLKSPMKTIQKYDDDELGYFVDAEWQSRPLKAATGGKTNSHSRQRWLKIAFAVDYTVIDFHGKNKIKQYIMALLNIVSVIYKDPSLDANMNLVLSRLIFFEEKVDSHIKEGSAKKSLEAVNRWNFRLITKLPKNERPHDVAVWLTREYLGGPSGYAPVAGVCDKTRSTALNKDEGLASAFIIAHEVAHILGLTHDGDAKAGNDCYNDIKRGTIMAPTVTATFHRFSWSPCSKKEFHKLIKRWTCLLNPPKGKNHIILNAGISHTFTMDEQCRMEYGDGYSSCKSLPMIEPCSHLWCGHENSSLYCITKKGPPVEGTQCGFDKWCIDGFCQAVDGRLSLHVKTPRPGGWSPWSPWSECSRTCSYGVKRRTRLCDNPEPEDGGEPCKGHDEEVEVCKNKKRCWETPFSDTKASICSKLATSVKDFDVWLPYESEDDDGTCQMSCVYWDTGEIRKSDENLPDGVPCSYESQHHICVEGECKKLGCDGEENSTLIEDTCGQCGGSGTSCDKSTYSFHRPLRKEIMRLTTLRRFSRGISININLLSKEWNQILVDSKIHLALKDQSKIYKLSAKEDSVAQPLRLRPESQNMIRATEESSIVLAGTLIRTSRFESTFRLTATGPLNSDIVVLMYSPVEYLNTIEAVIEFNYTLPYSSLRLNARAMGRYKWVEGICECEDYSVQPICVDTLWKNRTVSNKLCPYELKLNYVKTCSSATCHYYWITGKWEFCSSTCGSNGIQHRQVYCVPKWINETDSVEKIWKHMVQPDKCIDVKPSHVQPCNRISCPAHWIEGPWTPCTVTCGHEISYRTFKCSSNEEDACGPKPLFLWRKCGGSCQKHNCRDRSPSCGLQFVLRYCAIPEFRKLCCASCFDE